MYSLYRPNINITGLPTSSSQTRTKGNLASVYGQGGAKHWLELTKGVTIENSYLSRWEDSINPGYFLTQSTLSSKPFYISKEPLLNNLPVISFSHLGTPRFLNNTGLLFGSLSPYWCVVFIGVFVANASGSYQMVWWNGGSANTTSFSNFGNQWQFWKGGSGYGFGTITNTASIVIITQDRFIVNGVDITTSAYRSSGLYPLYNILPFSRNSSDNWWGRVAELVVYEGRYSDTQLYSLSDRINFKYKIY